MIIDREAVRIALSVLSGRRVSEDLDDWELYRLGIEAYEIDCGEAIEERVQRAAEQVILDAICPEAP